jgi:hypothetical protein
MSHLRRIHLGLDAQNMKTQGQSFRSEELRANIRMATIAFRKAKKSGVCVVRIASLFDRHDMISLTL